MEKMKQWWANVPSPIKSGVLVLLWTFLGTLATLGIGTLQDFVNWFASQAPDTGEEAVPFPDLKLVADAAVSAAIGLITGVITLVVRFLQQKTALIPGNPPQYNPPQG